MTEPAEQKSMRVTITAAYQKWREEMIDQLLNQGTSTRRIIEQTIKEIAADNRLPEQRFPPFTAEEIQEKAATNHITLVAAKVELEERAKQAFCKALSRHLNICYAAAEVEWAYILEYRKTHSTTKQQV